MPTGLLNPPPPFLMIRILIIVISWNIFQLMTFLTTWKNSRNTEIILKFETTERLSFLYRQQRTSSFAKKWNLYNTAKNTNFLSTYQIDPNTGKHCMAFFPYYFFLSLQMLLLSCPRENPKPFQQCARC